MNRSRIIIIGAGEAGARAAIALRDAGHSGPLTLVSEEAHAPYERPPLSKTLIVSPEAFNRITKLPVILPITSGGNFARTAGFAVLLTGAGTKTTGVVRCDQPRALDLAARGARKLESIPDAIMDEVLAKIAPIFE